MLEKLFSLKKNKNISCAAVLVAAGSATRMQGTDKIFAPVGGEPLIAHTIRVFEESPSIREIVVVTRQDLVDPMGELCNKIEARKVTAVVPGGASRPESVQRGLDAVDPNTPLVAIHDGARPFVTAEIIEQTIAKAQQYHAAAPAVPVKDTIKIAKNHIVTKTPDRAELFAVQTPQIFDFDLLRGALQQALTKQLPITDDCSAVEALGMSVYLTAGSDENIKITTPTDLILAEAIAQKRRTEP